MWQEKSEALKPGPDLLDLYNLMILLDLYHLMWLQLH